MKLAPLFLGELKAVIPIIQGGMGIGVSRSRLASAVASEGGIGVISGVQIGFDEPDFEVNSKEANLRALRNEIRKAKQAVTKGIFGVNLLVAMNNYKEMAQCAVKEGIDLIISGAGLPTELPNIVKNTKTKAVPIVSSGKAAAVILKLWEKRCEYIPDAIIVEGPEAGGHLGFTREDMMSDEHPSLSKILKDVKNAISDFEKKYSKKISVVAAGGIYSGADIVNYQKEGADGVQMATRFVATHECDAHINYKNMYLDSKKEDIIIVKSPVGMPGRALNNKFIQKLLNGNIPVEKCYGCLKPCNPKETPYCISKALIEAVKGNVDEGLIFTGSNSYKLKEIISVKELIQNIINEAALVD